MEPKCLSKVQQLDRITTLPQPIIETILCLLPIEEAARTSILSRDWRYKWTTIPKLNFSHYSGNISTEESYMCNRKDMSDIEHEWIYNDIVFKRFSAIKQVLLQHQGPLHEFSLTMDADALYLDIDQIILDLSRNHTLKKLTLNFDGCDSYDLPSSVFSLRHLTEIYLNSCRIYYKPISNGFGSLTSLSLKDIIISKETFLQLLSNCPSLKSLYLDIEFMDPRLDKYEGPLGDEHESPKFMKIFKCLPMIEHITTSGCFILSLVQVSVSEELPTSLIHLKCCTIVGMCFVDRYGLPFLCTLIKCSPNLEKIKLEINPYCCSKINCAKFEEHSAQLEEYSDVWLEHLNEVEIKYFGNFEPELEFVKFIIARSPSLKKVTLLTYRVNKNEELEMLKILLCVPPVSPVKIFVENLSKRA